MKTTIAVLVMAALVARGQSNFFCFDYHTDGNTARLTNFLISKTSTTTTPNLHGHFVVEVDSKSQGASWTPIWATSSDTLPMDGTYAAPMQNGFSEYRAVASPCLAGRVVVAYHLHHGFNGFLAPHHNKYLNRLVHILYYNVTSNDVITTFDWTRNYTMDRISGIIDHTPDTNEGQYNNFATYPFNQPPSTNDPNWTVSETHFRVISDSGAGTSPEYFIITDVTLSQPYTLTQLDADTDALIDRELTNNTPWGTLTPCWYPQEGDPEFSDTGNPFVDSQTYFPAGAVLNIPAPQMNETLPWTVSGTAAAGCFYGACGFVGGVNPAITYDSPCDYFKWVCLLRSPNGWAQKTVGFSVTNYAAVQTSTECHQSGTDCGNIVRLETPAGGPGTNWYVMATPGGLCQ